MLSKIIEWSGRNRFLVLLATLFIVLWGVFAVLRTPIDALPDLCLLYTSDAADE